MKRESELVHHQEQQQVFIGSIVKHSWDRLSSSSKMKHVQSSILIFKCLESLQSFNKSTMSLDLAEKKMCFPQLIQRQNPVLTNLNPNAATTTEPCDWNEKHGVRQTSYY